MGNVTIETSNTYCSHVNGFIQGEKLKLIDIITLRVIIQGDKLKFIDWLIQGHKLKSIDIIEIY